MAGQKRKRRVICSSDLGKDRSERMVKVGMRIRQKHPFNSRGQAQISQFAFLFVMAFLGSLLIFPRLSPQSEQELKDRALLKEMALTPIYDDEKGVRPMYGTIKAEFVVDGTVTEKEGSRETTTTYKANASWTIQYDESGITETKTLSGTENVVIVEKDQDPPLQLTEKTTYSLDPSEAVLMRTYGSKGAGELGVVASEKQKCCWFDIKDEGALKVKTHTEGKWWNGMKYQPFTNDYDENWFIWFDIPSHWQGLAKCLATGKYCSPGVVEGSFSDGKTSGSYSAPVFFARGGAIWEPTLRALGRPVDPSMVQGRDTVSWNLGGKPQDVEAVIIPFPGFEGWIPEGGKDEDTEGGFPFVVDAKLRLKNKPDKETSEKAKFKFELIDTSKEPGLCLNAPKKDKAKRSFDLKFRQEENPDLKVSNEGQTAQSKEYQESETVVISSYDWGAYGKLKVTATLASGEQVIAHVEGKPQQEMLVIPCDKNDNRVADEWEKQEGVFDKKLPANWDGAEEPKGQKAAGDGISLYEKYRGFEFEGIHERLDPNQKYLFVHDPDEIVRRVAKDSRVQGTSFEAVSQLRLRYVDDDHWTGLGSSSEDKRIVNFNTGWKEGHAVDQHAISVKVEEGEWIEGIIPAGWGDARKRAGKLSISYSSEQDGFTFPDLIGGFGSPRRTYQIMLFPELIQKNEIREYVKFAYPNIRTLITMQNNGTLGFDDFRWVELRKWLAEYIKTHPKENDEAMARWIALVLAHEMSHAVGVEHHDPPKSGSAACVIGKGFPAEVLPDDPLKGLAEDPFLLKLPWPNEICRDRCWSRVIVSDLADQKAGK